MAIEMYREREGNIELSGVRNIIGIICCHSANTLDQVDITEPILVGGTTHF